MAAPQADLGSQRELLSASDVGALAHLYRAEVYRSTIWRTRLDNTTNWSVVTLGIALSITYSSAEASPVPLVLVGILISLFLILEARRYRYFNVWRARARWMEKNFYAPLLQNTGQENAQGWQDKLASDYIEPRYHITFLRAVGRRLRRNYVWILMIQTVSYVGKIVIHPTPVSGMAELAERASIGPVPGELILLCGVLYNLAWIGVGLSTSHQDRKAHQHGKASSAMG
jgi:uncharacterized membrane protein